VRSTTVHARFELAATVPLPWLSPGLPAMWLKPSTTLGLSLSHKESRSPVFPGDVVDPDLRSGPEPALPVAALFRLLRGFRSRLLSAPAFDSPCTAAPHRDLHPSGSSPSGGPFERIERRAPLARNVAHGTDTVEAACHPGSAQFFTPRQACVPGGSSFQTVPSPSAHCSACLLEPNSLCAWFPFLSKEKCRVSIVLH
jgi:hypothetical protein